MISIIGRFSVAPPSSLDDIGNPISNKYELNPAHVLFHSPMFLSRNSRFPSFPALDASDFSTMRRTLSLIPVPHLLLYQGMNKILGDQ